MLVQTTWYFLSNHDMNHVLVLLATAVSFVLNKVALEDTKTAALDVEEAHLAEEPQHNHIQSYRPT